MAYTMGEQAAGMGARHRRTREAPVPAPATHTHNGDHYTDAECPCGSQAGKPVREVARVALDTV